MCDIKVNVSIDVSERLCEFLAAFLEPRAQSSEKSRKPPGAKEKTETRPETTETMETTNAQGKDSIISTTKPNETIDFETLKALFTSKLQENGKRKALKGILAEFNASRLSELSEEHYLVVYNRLKEGV